ncbi:MAG: hypothetical protein AAGB11_02140 [Pseudomonadota bacterium]
MAYIIGTDRWQLLLMSERLKGYVGPCNPVRFIDGFVDQLGLLELRFVRAETMETRRPDYQPGDLSMTVGIPATMTAQIPATAI